MLSKLASIATVLLNVRGEDEIVVLSERDDTYSPVAQSAERVAVNH